MVLQHEQDDQPPQWTSLVVLSQQRFSLIRQYQHIPVHHQHPHSLLTSIGLNQTSLNKLRFALKKSIIWSISDSLKKSPNLKSPLGFTIFVPCSTIISESWDINFSKSSPKINFVLTKPLPVERDVLQPLLCKFVKPFFTSGEIILLLAIVPSISKIASLGVLVIFSNYNPI